MNPQPPLPPASRAAIVLIALLQGLMLYAVQEAAYHGPFQAFATRLCWYTWVLSVPTAVALTLVDLRDRRLWLHAALASALVLAMAGWIGWNLGGTRDDLRQAPLLMPFSVCVAVAVFVALPWWQFRLQHGHWRATYAALFERAWQNGLTLALALGFTGLTWMLLWLWAALFDLVDIHFFRDLFREKAFIALATGMLFGFGVLIGRTQDRAIQVIRQVLFAVARGLLPLLAFIAVIFVVCLPFTGLEPLWRTRSAATVLLALVLLLIVFSNAVYQHESELPPYPAWLRRLIEASLLTLPVYAALALYAMGLRISQYGVTLERFWALLAALLVCGYAVGYALAAVRRRGRWLQRIEPVNRWMCWVVLGAAVLANTPVLDPIRISLASQVARLQATAPAIKGEDATDLRFGYGRRGAEVLKELQQDPRFRDDPRASTLIANVLSVDARRARYGDYSDAIKDLKVLQQQLKLAKSSPAPDPDWWQALLARTVNVSSCLEMDEFCVALRRDLDGDGVDEMLLCHEPSWGGAACRLHARDGKDWTDAGKIEFPMPSEYRGDPAYDPLLRGNLTVHPARWPQLSLGDGPRLGIEQPPVEDETP